MTLANNIISFNEGMAYHGYASVPPDHLFVTCNDIYGNTEGDWIWDLEGFLGIDGNINLDPQFVDREHDNYHLQPGSPCRPGLDCGLIGALSVLGMEAVMYNVPDGSGTPLTSAKDYYGNPVDASITIQLDTQTPAEDIWLASSFGGLAGCPGGTIADGPTDPDAQDVRLTFECGVHSLLLHAAAGAYD